MKKIISFFRITAVQRIAYIFVLLLLIVTALLQTYRLWQQTERPSERDRVSGQVEPDTQASMLEPFDMYLTRDGIRFARVNALSGIYQDLWTVTRTLITRMVRSGLTVTPVRVEELPEDRAGIALQYAFPLPAEAVRELLQIEDETGDIKEIILIPSQTRNEPAMMYLVDQDQSHVLRADSKINVSTKAAQNFNERFMDCLDSVAPEYIDAHRRFPAMFLDECYVHELESRTMYHIPEISVSYVQEGVLDTEAASSYIMHFFEHPDVARQVEQGKDFVWYADEKHTVRYDAHGLLQYVSTQRPSEREMLPLTEAYQLACGFLREDLAFDRTLLQEIYFCDFESSGDGTYTFCWNYAYNHVPFSMSGENRSWTDLSYPIRIVVEGRQVRYYHRYLLDKNMTAEGIFSIRETYIEALDEMLKGLPEQARIRSFSLEYEEIDGRPVLYWKVDTDHGQLSLPAGEVRV
ncbi:MAG: hypothetical protein K6A77_01250 [Clostridiales bacterium]|nr:hypothetical protein [Clostridiales bacterium]